MAPLMYPTECEQCEERIRQLEDMLRSAVDVRERDRLRVAVAQCRVLLQRLKAAVVVVSPTESHHQ